MPAELLALGRVRFEAQPPVEPSAPTRADIACFVGFVSRRPGALPASLERWLEERGWLGEGPYARPEAKDLVDVPVPVDNWVGFDRLFAWEARAGGGSTYLGAAVRSFFAQGGRRCYVVRVGDPLPVGSPRDARLALLEPLLGTAGGAPPSPGDRRSWKGVRHLFGLPDVSLLCVPDLPDVFGADPLPAPPPPEAPPPRPVFEECSAQELVPIAAPGAPPIAVARMGTAEYAAWAGAVNELGRLLRDWLREVQLIAAVPLPTRYETLEHELPAHLAHEFLNAPPGDGPSTGLATSFVQLVYPWVKTAGSVLLPDGVEPPDGVLAGVIARTVLLRGAFRSAAGSALGDVVDVFPSLTRADLAVGDGRAGDLTVFPDRISTFGRGPTGLRLLTDTTPSLRETYRPAAVHRLVSLVIRAVRQVGEALVWESSGERLWRLVQRRIEGMLQTLWEAGALSGASSDEAFTVRCDRTTMTTTDLDAGRLMVVVTFTASAPIERITVTLAMDESGQVSVAGLLGAAA